MIPKNQQLYDLQQNKLFTVYYKRETERATTTSFNFILFQKAKTEEKSVSKLSNHSGHQAQKGQKKYFFVSNIQ